MFVYIGTENVEINLLRIERRVLAGGHDVPEEDVRRRCLRSLENLPVAVRRADHTLLFDNSTADGYQLAGLLSLPAVRWFEPLPNWAATLKVALSAR